MLETFLDMCQGKLEINKYTIPNKNIVLPADHSFGSTVHYTNIAQVYNIRCLSLKL